jgi:DNA (cytosine-5)-methyltransferase 1
MSGQKSLLIVSRKEKASQLDSVEICAGAGGQALGLETAGFGHAALVEIEPDAQKTLRLTLLMRPS